MELMGHMDPGIGLRFPACIPLPGLVSFKHGRDTQNILKNLLGSSFCFHLIQCRAQGRGFTHLCLINSILSSSTTYYHFCLIDKKTEIGKN